MPLRDALWGAVAGYLSLWIVYWVFKLLTGKEGMGYGDFKLLAALGAWLGWQMLLPIILLSSVDRRVVGIAHEVVAATLREGRYVPFGPFLAGAGLAAMLFGRAARARWPGWPEPHGAECRDAPCAVGLTGGIGSGKSTVLRCWSSSAPRSSTPTRSRAADRCRAARPSTPIARAFGADFIDRRRRARPRAHARGAPSPTRRRSAASRRSCTR